MFASLVFIVAGLAVLILAYRRAGSRDEDIGIFISLVFLAMLLIGAGGFRIAVSELPPL